MKSERGKLHAILFGCALISAGCGGSSVETSDSSAPGETDTRPDTTPPGPFVQVAAAWDRTCAVDKEGSVFCWGVDLLGESWDDVALSPAHIPSVESASRVALTEGYACALIDQKGLQCWGYTPFAGPVDADTPPLPPSFLPDSATAIDFAVSEGRACAVLADGGVRCWGTMGDPGACFGPDSPTYNPFDVPGVTDATSVAVSGSATCFTRSGGLPACYFDAPEPTFVELGFPDAVRLRISESDGCYSAHASYCAVSVEGKVDCYEGFPPGELGDILHVHDGSPPAAEILWRDAPEAGGLCIKTQGGGLWCDAADGGTVLEASDLAMTATHACAISDGSLACWGSNEWGALGVGLPSRRAEARPVADLDDAVALAVGEDHACAARSNGEVVCWGSNQGKQRGWESTPVPATYHPRWAWYPDELSELPKSVPLVSGISDVFADGYRTCAAQAQGPLLCWGQDLIARLALSSPTEIPDVTAAVSVAPGDDSQSCAVVSSGAVECWGRGWYGTRIGVETLALAAPAVSVDGDTYHACALLETGEVYCWGGQIEGSIGADGDPLSPKKVPGIEDAIDLSGTCVVTTAHELVCWSFVWQWGLVPEGVPTVLATGVRDVDGPCVVRDDGHVECFLDYGARDWTAALGFQQVAGVEGATRVASGAQHACALLQTGQVACWGWAAAGRLGDGSRTIFTDPQAVTGAP